MGFTELFLIAIGLSMDAFAVAVCRGLSMEKRIDYKQAYLIGIFFGGFQALMPLIGWFLGSSFEKYIVEVDHWVAFLLLAFIGGKMIYESITEKDSQPDCSLCIKSLIILSVATSIDALAVGITFAFLRVRIIPAILLIGLTTFLLSLLGVWIGNKFGSKFKNKAELAGGVILVLIGLKILLEHLGLLSF